MARYELNFRPSVAKDLRDIAKTDVKDFSRTLTHYTTNRVHLVAKNLLVRKVIAYGKVATGLCTASKIKSSLLKYSRLVIGVRFIGSCDA